jgi:hypothetical protein
MGIMDSDVGSAIFVDMAVFCSRRHHRHLKNRATEIIDQVMATCTFEPKGGFGKGRGRGRGHPARGRGDTRHYFIEGKRPLVAKPEEFSHRALAAACNKLSYDNFDKIYILIMGFVKTMEGTITFLIRRGSESGSFAELYVRMFKKLCRDGLDDEVKCGFAAACAAFVQSGGLHIAPLVVDESYDDFCARLLVKRRMLSLIQILCSDTHCAEVIVPTVLGNFSNMIEHPESDTRDLVVDGFAVVHRMCPKWRKEAKEMALTALDRGGLDTRTRFKVMDVIESR